MIFARLFCNSGFQDRLFENRARPMASATIRSIDLDDFITPSQVILDFLLPALHPC